MTTTQEGVAILSNDRGELVGFIRKDPISRKNVMYSAQEMGLEEIESVIKNEDRTVAK